MSNRPNPRSSNKLVVPANYESLQSVREFVTSACKRAGLGEKECYKVQLAVDEACSNIIEHAYASVNAGEDQIECTCNITTTALIIQLHDSGKPFDPEQIPTPDTNLALEERRSGGLGLFFMREYMDEVIFHSVPKAQKNRAPDGSNREGNYLILVKRTDEIE